MRAQVLVVVAIIACSGGEAIDLGTLYTPCEFDTECTGEGETCHALSGTWSGEFHMARMCSQECSTSADCPNPEGAFGVCHSLSPRFDRCYIGCTTDDQCPDGFFCGDIPQLGRSLCVP